MSDWDGTEAECLSEWLEGFEHDEDYVPSNDRINLFKSRYNVAKAANVGSSINCPTCNKVHPKTTYHKVFCGRKRCKDEYWNTVSDPRRERAKKYKK